MAPKFPISAFNIEKTSTSLPSTCRICLEGDGLLMRPCRCKGTMGSVHLACLNEWRRLAKKPGSFWHCDTCRFRYRFREKSSLQAKLHIFCQIVLLPLAMMMVVIVSGYIMKLLERLLTHQKLYWEEFVPIDALHLLYGLMLPASIGLGPFASVLNMGAPSLLAICFTGSTEVGIQDIIEMVLSMVGIVIGCMRVSAWIGEYLNCRLRKRFPHFNNIADIRDVEISNISVAPNSSEEK